MISDNIILFIIMLVLSYAFRDDFLFEVIVGLFALMLYSFSVVTTLTTPASFFQSSYLFLINLLVVFACLFGWISDYRKGKEAQ
jgi:hypothetical protein